VLIDSRFSTVIYAPVYSTSHGLASQVPVGAGEGLLHDSGIHCDELVSLPKSALTRFVGRLGPDKLRDIDRALVAALGIEISSLRS
jgi:mRNA interferase MazF